MNNRETNLNIIAVGGGRIYAGETKAIDVYAFSLLPSDNKTMAILPTASKDRPDYIQAIKEVYEALGAKTIAIYEQDLAEERLIEILAHSAGLYIGGGDVNYLFQKLTETKSLENIIDFARSGKLIVGLSAGCALFFEKTIFLEGERLATFDGAGVIGSVVLPHYEPRLLEKCEKSILTELERSKNIYGIPDGCAMHFNAINEYVIVREPHAQEVWQISNKSGTMRAESIS